MSFDPVNTTLVRGITRLEASAGTGKTFTLAGVFLRLVLEFNVPATEILVVTYTKAATAELRGRIRCRLRDAQLAFKRKLGQAQVLCHDEDAKDDLLEALLLKVEPQKAVQSLNLALELIDEVSIDTIHAFCQRTLRARAFESGVLFDVELVPDQRELLDELAADYFRREIYPKEPTLAAAAIWKGITPDVLAKMLKRFVTYPNLRLNSEPPSRRLESIAGEIQDRMEDCRHEVAQIAENPAAFVDYFMARPKWTTKEHAKPECIGASLAQLDASLKPGAASSDMWEAIEFFSLSAVEKDTGTAGGQKKPRPQPQPPLFEVCETLLQLASDYALAHHLSFLQWAPAEMRQRKQHAKQQSYDDLIGRLADALEGGSGEALANSVRKQYQAALIDEFQDTDPQQWKIFRRIFGGNQSHWLFLIGDPKQAIYGFRGADVSTYVEAAASANAKHELNTNWRSESGLVRALNTVFAQAGKQTVFLEKGIHFEEVEPSEKADQEPFTIDAQRPPPLQVWCWESAKGPVGAGQARKQLPISVSAEISRLLSAKSCCLKNRRLQPRDIAVLVESHDQASRIKNALKSLGIPAVELAQESVLETEEARELHWILMGILEPGRESLVKSALTTDTLGWTADRLLKESTEEKTWQPCVQRFAGYRDVWEQEGFFYMFSRLLRAESVFENLLRFADGERRITNLLHLAELIETASKAQHLGPLRLLQWLEARRLSDEATPEEYQLRLESDEDAVRIVTIHASKGLEYPVVFCPFFQKDASLKPIKGDDGRPAIKQVVLYHDAETNQMAWDLSPEPAPANQERAGSELLAEKLRLLYVALTRARNRCYLVSAAYQRNKSTALAWLMHPAKEEVTDPVAALEENPPGLGVWKARWNAIADASVDPATGQPTIAVADLPIDQGLPWSKENGEAETLQALSCGRKEIHPAWYLSSFTVLSSRLAARHTAALEGDQPDHDEAAVPAEIPEGAEPPVPAAGIFALPPGARTGDCLHKILEQFDFSAAADSPANARLVKEKLEGYGLSEEFHLTAVAGMLGRLCVTPLEAGNQGFSLSQIPRDHQVAELEFHLPTAACDGAALVRAIRSTTPGMGLQMRPETGNLRPELHNFLKGFIDLVFQFGDRFYLLDWKSNHLGNRAEDYDQKAMEDAIAESFYDLQYHLYTLALDKYLRLRVPGYDYEKHFGGVRYVFLRGVTPERPDLAIYRARPSQSVMADLAKVLGISWGRQS